MSTKDVLETKVYHNPHHFNPFLMKHIYLRDGTVRRAWVEKMQLDVAERDTAPDYQYPLDGSLSLGSMLDDIYRSFCFTSTNGVMSVDGKWRYCNDVEMERHLPIIDQEMLSTIYETKLPPGTEVYRYQTGMVCQGVIEMLQDSDLIDSSPQTYYDLFKIIGIECEYWKPQKVGKYTIWQYPDSVILSLNAIGNKLFFGYSR
jgi:hypothetical protein